MCYKFSPDLGSWRKSFSDGLKKMYLVSLESSLKMWQNGVCFVLISWKLIELTTFQIWKKINYFFQILDIFPHFFMTIYLCWMNEWSWLWWQGSHTSINVWECYEIWEKNIQDWKCYGNLQNVLEKCSRKISSVLDIFWES